MDKVRLERYKASKAGRVSFFLLRYIAQNSICGDCAKWPCSAFLGGVEMYISNVLTTKTAKCLK